MKKYIGLMLPIILMGTSLIKSMERPPHQRDELEADSQQSGKRARILKDLVMPEFGKREILPLYRNLLEAAARGDFDYVRQNLHRDYHIQLKNSCLARSPCTDDQGRCLLCFAASNHHAEIFEFLLPASPPEKMYITWHLLAALKESRDEKIATIFINRMFPETYQAYRKLFVALLLDSEEAINEELNASFRFVCGNDDQVYRPLHAAVLFRSALGIRLILNRKCPVDILNANEHSALKYAVKIGYYDIIEELFKGQADARPFMPSMLFKAAHYDQVRLLQLFLDNGIHATMQREDGSTALHEAAFEQHIDCVNLLLARGALVNAVDDQGETPLHCMARNSFKSDWSPAVVQSLLENGALVNARIVSGPHVGQTALNLALAWVCGIFGGQEVDLNADGFQQVKHDIAVIKELLLWGARASGDYERALLSRVFLKSKPLLVAVMLNDVRALHLVAPQASHEERNEALLVAIAQQQLSLVDVLLQLGAQTHAGFEFLERVLLRKHLTPQARQTYERIQAILIGRMSLRDLIIRRTSLYDTILQRPEVVSLLPNELRGPLVNTILLEAVQSRNFARTQKALELGAEPRGLLSLVPHLNEHPEIGVLLIERARQLNKVPAKPALTS